MPTLAPPPKQVVAVKVLNSGGSGSYTGIIAGINWTIADCGARTSKAEPTRNVRCIINMSLGGPSDGGLTTAVNAAVAAGVPVVVAAGNENSDACGTYPAAVPNAVTVGATDENDARSVWSRRSASNDGSCVDVFAPGTSIKSLTRCTCWSAGRYYLCGGACYASWSGTSMATPHVAGAALLLWPQHSSLSAAELSNMLVELATPGVIQPEGLRSGTPNKMLYSPYLPLL